MPIAKYFYYIASLVITGYLLSFFSIVFNPVLAAFVLALALKPLVEGLENIKIPKIISALTIVFLFITVLLIIIAFFTTEIGDIDFETESWGGQFDNISDKLKDLVYRFLGINHQEQAAIVKKSFSSFLKNSTSLINNTLSFTTTFFSALVLFIFALFFFLYYRHFLVSFLYQLFNTEYHPQLKRGLNRIQMVVKHYIFGLSLIIITVSVLNTIGLLFLNIENAVLFGVLAGVLTLIPYIGIIIGSLLPIIFTFFTKDSLWYPLGVLFIFLFVQFLEGNFLTPNIVGKQVRVNPFAAIFGLIIGGMLLGIIGVIFTIPVLAIIKVICDETPPWRPIGFLLGQPDA